MPEEEYGPRHNDDNWRRDPELDPSDCARIGKALTAVTKARLDYTMIRSPINGKIGIRKLDPGNLIGARRELALMTMLAARHAFHVREARAKFTLPRSAFAVLV